MSLTTLPEALSRNIVRIKTSTWSDSRGLHIRKDVTYLKRKSAGDNFLEYEIDNVGAEDARLTVVNLDECADGIYEVIICNVSKDWETGHIDDYDLRLVPYQG